jgi:hypothetical protein
VSADIEDMILGQKKQALQGQFMQELRTRASVEFLDEALFKSPEPPISGDVSGDLIVPDEPEVEETASADISGDQ